LGVFTIIYLLIIYIYIRDLHPSALVTRYPKIFSIPDANYSMCQTKSRTERDKIKRLVGCFSLLV
jgi:hypothetical protein